MKTPAFVYGTLLEGFGNYSNILKGNVDSIKPATLEGFQMYSVSGGGFPAILPGKGTVVGELMYIEERKYNHILKRLDQLEGYYETSERHSMYLRRTMKVTTESGEEVEAYVYIWNRGIPGPKVESGDWRSYKELANIIFRASQV